jgi:XRE family transcriptional regulator, thiamine biosynthesis regulator
MQPPDELMTGGFLPAMRHLVAVRLRARGLSQSKISSLLGVTQASVSLYLSADPAKAYRVLTKLSVNREQADMDSSLLAEDLSKGVGAARGVATLERIWTALLGTGGACQAHREMYPSLADCDFCIKEYGGRQGSTAEAISEVADAARMLEDSPEFIRVMPEVSVNIACAAPGASTPGEVVAIPGRMVKVKGRARAMLPPEPGASVHMSKMLILTMGRQPRLRACINVRYDREMARALKKSGLRTITIGNYPRADRDDPTADALEKRLVSSRGPFDAIIDEGGAGIEPNVYLFARSPRDVVQQALRLARSYSAC